MDKRSSTRKLDSMYFPQIISSAPLIFLLLVRRLTSCNNKQRTTLSMPLALSQLHLLSLNPPVSCSLNSQPYLHLPNSQRILSPGFRPWPLDTLSHKQRKIPFAGTLWRHNPPGFRHSLRRTNYSQPRRASIRFQRSRMASLSRPIHSRSLGSRHPIRSGRSTAVHMRALQARQHI